VRYLAWGIIIGITLGFGASEFWHRDRSRLAPTATEAIRDSIKSDFALVDHTGKSVTDENYRGKWLLVFFGFTNCPDVCPTALNEIAQIIENLGEKAAKVQPLFITIDPERDTPERMAEFVSAFDPRITGLTGTPEQIKASTKSFKVYYAKEVQKGAPDGYTMEHTASLYLIDPKGRFVRPYSYNATIEEISDDLRERLQG
tara:strand:+ start:36532 stop:37134 length:603 start_codon:yes stop_codon:yes gene_type:complete